MLDGLDVSFVLETVLAALLGATLIFCAILERRLRALRHDQTELSNTIQALNSGIVRAQMSLGALRSAAAEAGETLTGKIGTARALADELSVLTSSGERVAARFETARGGTSARPPARAPVLGDRLRAVR